MLGCQVHVAKSSTLHCKCYFCQLHIPLPIAHCKITNSTSHCQLHIAKSPTPHLIANCALPNHQLHIGKLSTPHCECYIANLPSWLHFLGCPNVLQIVPTLHPPPPPKCFLLVCSMSKTYSPGCPYKDFHGLFFYPPTLCTYLPTI
jgi:hypothetical protein